MGEKVNFRFICRRDGEAGAISLEALVEIREEYSQVSYFLIEKVFKCLV